MSVKCSMCRKKLEPDEVCHAKNSPKILCEDCLWSNFYQCDRCQEYVALEELADYDIPDCYDDICIDCARKLLKQCADCSCFILPETTVVVDNKTYCPDCSEAYLYQCDVCKKYVKLEELADYDISDCYDDICIDCARKLLKQCADCSCFILPETTVVVDNKTYCPDCSEAYLYQCDVCKKYVKFDKLEAYDIPDGYDDICRECFQKKFFLCSKCEEYYPADQAVTDEKGNKYCRFCGWKYAPIECFHCQTKVLGKDALFVRLPDGDIAVCAQCAQSHYRRCYGCKMLKPIKEAIKVETVWSCKECRGTVKKLLLEERRRQALAQSLNFLRGLQIARIILNAFRGKFW